MIGRLRQHSEPRLRQQAGIEKISDTCRTGFSCPMGEKSSFLADECQAILNNVQKSKINRKPIANDNKSKPKQKLRIETVSENCSCGGCWGSWTDFTRALPSPKVLMWFITYELFKIHKT